MTQPLNDSFTLQCLFNMYMELHARPHCKSWENMQRIYNSYLIQLADRPAASISKLELVQLHSQIGLSVGRTTANRVLELLRPMYNKAAEFGYPLSNPAAGIKKFRMKPRERFLEHGEIQKFFAAVDTLRYAVTRDFILMCLFTAARRSNVAEMQWKHVNIENRIWYIPETKNGLSQYVPLTDEAMAILARRKAGSDSLWVFPSYRSKTGHLTKPEEAWKMIVERSGLDNVRLHDLRRTLASWQALTGANLSVIAATLNHQDIKSTQIYARLNVAAVRVAMETATKRMTE